MFCASCGKKTNPSGRFCINCGEPLNAFDGGKRISANTQNSGRTVGTSGHSAIAWTSLSLSVAGLVVAIVPYIAWLGWALVLSGIVLAILGWVRKANPPGIRIAGLVVGAVGTLLFVIVCVLSMLKLPDMTWVSSAIRDDRYSPFGASCASFPDGSLSQTLQPILKFQCILAPGPNQSGASEVYDVEYNWLTTYVTWQRALTD